MRIRQFANSRAATAGKLALLMPGAAPGAFPVDVTIQAAGATMSAKGSVTDARAMTGATIALSAEIPDLSALSPLARRPLPAVKQIARKHPPGDLGRAARR